MSALFGPAGQCEESRAEAKNTVEFIRYLAARGATAFEYQCGRGVNIGESKAREIGDAAKEAGIQISLHAPYYISLASAEEQKRENSVGYILQSARAVQRMGGTRIVVHPGGLGKMERAEATELACTVLSKARRKLDEEGYEDVILCPETMGKVNQLGNLSEILTFCRLDGRNIPCIDFGHLNARTQGGLKSKEDFAQILIEIEKALGRERLTRFHSHFSKIEYSKGGEVRHLTFEDKQYGPKFEFLMELVAEQSLSPTFICESAGTQTRDALLMKKHYTRLASKAKRL